MSSFSWAGLNLELHPTSHVCQTLGVQINQFLPTHCCYASCLVFKNRRKPSMNVWVYVALHTLWRQLVLGQHWMAQLLQWPGSSDLAGHRWGRGGSSSSLPPESSAKDWPLSHHGVMLHQPLIAVCPVTPFKILPCLAGSNFKAISQPGHHDICA